MLVSAMSFCHRVGKGLNNVTTAFAHSPSAITAKRSFVVRSMVKAQLSITVVPIDRACNNDSAASHALKVEIYLGAILHF